MFIGSAHPELFTAIGSFSPVIYEGTEEWPFKELPIENLVKSKSKPFFFRGIGEKEDQRFINYHQLVSDYLNDNKYPSVRYKSTGTYHEWLIWRRCLYEFAQKLFR